MSDDRPTLTVVPLYDGAMAADVVGSLRRAATTIEGETEDDNRTVAMVAVQVCEDGSLRVYGWGNTHKYHAIGVLTAGAAELL